MDEFKKNRHVLYKLTYHLVVTTKYRHKCINNVMHTRLREIAVDLFTKWDCEIIEMNGEEDHIHILFDAPPQIQLSKIINSFKTVSSRYIRKSSRRNLPLTIGSHIFGAKAIWYSQQVAQQLKL